MTEAPSPTMLDHALAAARRGIRVFPCVPKTKRPLIKDNLKRATTSEAILRAWWAEWPDANPAGVFDLVIDVDVKDGKQGAEGMADLDALDLLPATYTQRSPTGGFHLFYTAPGADVPNSVSKIAPGIDVRGPHGFVLLAGAQRPDGSYEIATDAPFAEAPGELVRLCGERRKRDPAATDLDPALADHPADIARAVELLNSAEPAVEGQGGDQATYDLACEVRDLGLTEATTLQLMLEHWNDQCSPPWGADDLAQKVCSAYAHAKDYAGNKSVAADFGAPDLEAQETLPARRFPLETIGDLRSLPPLRWLVPGWIPENALGIVYGKWGAGKSFLVDDLLLHLAYGLFTWHGIKLPGKPMDVLLVAREGHQGFVRRIDAFRKHHGLTAEPERLRFMRAPLSLTNDADFRILRAEIRECGIRFGLVVLDTVARAMPGVDMNEQQHVTQFMERCQQIGEAAGGGGSGATVIGVHHQNKSGTMLGSTFFEANSDFVFEVTRLGRDTGPLTAGEIRCTKMKDGEDQWRKAVAYERIQLPVADIEDGDASSLAVASISDVATTSAGPSIEETVAAALARNMLDGEASRTMSFNKLIPMMSAAERQAVGADVKDHKARKLTEAFDGETERVTNFGILALEKRRGAAGVAVTLRRSANGLSH